MNILIIEDDIYLASKISEVFENSILTNRVTEVHSYIWFLDELGHISSYDIVLTDIKLWSDKSGIDILKIIRRKNLSIPVVIISSISAYESLENAFFIGASDYIIKPFRLRELEIRVNKWFHDYAFSVSYGIHKEVSYYGLVYNISKNKFFFKWQNIPLPKNSKYVLSLFLIHSEKLLTERFLVEKIWWDYNSQPYTKNVRICILRLRERLDDFGVGTWIKNVRWEWYILEKF